LRLRTRLRASLRAFWALVLAVGDVAADTPSALLVAVPGQAVLGVGDEQVLSGLEGDFQCRAHPAGLGEHGRQPRTVQGGDDVGVAGCPDGHGLFHVGGGHGVSFPDRLGSAVCFLGGGASWLRSSARRSV